jgi:hypothetical protein
MLNVQWAGAAERSTLASQSVRGQLLTFGAHAVRMEDRCVLCAWSLHCSP